MINNVKFMPNIFIRYCQIIVVNVNIILKINNILYKLKNIIKFN